MPSILAGVCHRAANTPKCTYWSYTPNKTASEVFKDSDRRGQAGESRHVSYTRQKRYTRVGGRSESNDLWNWLILESGGGEGGGEEHGSDYLYGLFPMERSGTPA